MDRPLLVLLLLLLLLRQSMLVSGEDAAAIATVREAPGAAPLSMCGQRRGRGTAPTEAGQNTRRVRCAPRDELPPELKHQYTLDQVKGIFQDIKHRLGHLQVPNIEKQRKGKGRRRPTKQLKQGTLSGQQ